MLYFNPPPIEQCIETTVGDVNVYFLDYSINRLVDKTPGNSENVCHDRSKAKDNQFIIIYRERQTSVLLDN